MVRQLRLLMFTALLMAAISITGQAKPFQPVYFDDPNTDLQSAAFTPEQRSFFDRYVRALEQIAQGASAEEFFVMEYSDSNDAVEPLLGNINYDQGTPYNNKCPYLNGGRAVTGCVATAMAQVMRYYQYPANGTGTFTYTGGNDGARVATLMLVCGASLSMNYSKDGSGANLAKMDGLLKNNFGYSKNVQFISTLNSSNPEETIYYWGEDVVRPELAAGHPLIFAGFPAMGQTGHCFVIDGYTVMDGEYYYHVNWGWGGVGNCYCLLTNLQEPGGDNYSGYNLQMVYYIYPTSQDVESVEAEETNVHKLIQDGQLIIERNGVRYTVQGQTM